ncbi:hypothetical protein DPMN_058377 [Dreissena polymorpha]|uniref:Uncharacterized protein n=1 Tax=Dreissena polymorpha TaxID=45954 RepID=A0A9D4C1W8_DREPO|nr:hypothetical protein DPMN_058377 [Dreissena polymorpha]
MKGRLSSIDINLRSQPLVNPQTPAKTDKGVETGKARQEGVGKTPHGCVLRELCFKSKEITTSYTRLVTDADFDVDLYPNMHHTKLAFTSDHFVNNRKERERTNLQHW